MSKYGEDKKKTTDERRETQEMTMKQWMQGEIRGGQVAEEGTKKSGGENEIEGQ